MRRLTQSSKDVGFEERCEYEARFPGRSHWEGTIVQEKSPYNGFYWVLVTGFIIFVISYIAVAMHSTSLFSPFFPAGLAAVIGTMSIVDAFRNGDILRGFATLIVVGTLGFLARVVAADLTVGLAIIFSGILVMAAIFTAVLAVQAFLRQSNGRDDHVRSMQDVLDAAAAYDD